MRSSRREDLNIQSSLTSSLCSRSSRLPREQYSVTMAKTPQSWKKPMKGLTFSCLMSFICRWRCKCSMNHFTCKEDENERRHVKETLKGLQVLTSISLYHADIFQLFAQQSYRICRPNCKCIFIVLTQNELIFHQQRYIIWPCVCGHLTITSKYGFSQDCSHKDGSKVGNCVECLCMY